MNRPVVDQQAVKMKAVEKDREALQEMKELTVNMATDLRKLSWA